MKIGIFAPWGKGDVCNSTCALKYREQLWPNAKIVWFVCKENYDILAFTKEVDEIRVWPFPWNETNTDWQGFRTDIHGVMSNASKSVPCLSDIDKGFFSIPWSNIKMLPTHDLVDIPKAVFGVEMSAPWHPVINYSKEEEDRAKNFIASLPFKKNVMLETICRSGQSSWVPSFSLDVMKACENKLGKCNFIYASPSSAPQGQGIVECGSFSVRQCIPLYNMVDLFVGVSSGVSCATCAWSASTSVPRIELCGAMKVSTFKMARGKVFLATNQKQLLDKINEGAWI